LFPASITQILEALSFIALKTIICPGKIYGLGGDKLRQKFLGEKNLEFIDLV